MPWLGHAMERLPILEEAGIKRIVNGAIPHPPDGPPYLGPVAGVRNFWLCCGSSFGIAQGAGCGKYLAQWMLHGDAEINMTGFDPRRLGVFADEDYARAKGFQDYRMTYATPLPGEELPAGAATAYQPAVRDAAKQRAAFSPRRSAGSGPSGIRSMAAMRTTAIVATTCSTWCGTNAWPFANALAYSTCPALPSTTSPAPTPRRFSIVCAPTACPRTTAASCSRIFCRRTAAFSARSRSPGSRPTAIYLLSAAGAELRDLDHLVQGRLPSEDVTIANVTDERGVLVLAGPRSRDVLGKLTDADLNNASFRWLRARRFALPVSTCARCASTTSVSSAGSCIRRWPTCQRFTTPSWMQAVNSASPISALRRQQPAHRKSLSRLGCGADQ